MQAINHTEEFDLAYRFVTETNLNIFLTGKAGTGKTTFLKYLRQNSFKKMIVAAPTGVAAINAGGVTLHSLFHLPFAPFVPGIEINERMVGSHSLLSKIHYNKEKLNLFRNLEVLVIDEASMVASHTVDAIDTILKSVRRRHHEPFGGVQVLFIGDLHQLQPVVKNEEWQFLKEYYSSIFFFDSMVLREHMPVMVELKKIFRQKDESFVDILNEIRDNNLSHKNFDLLNTRLSRNYFPDDTDGYITLTTHNRQADGINKGKLQRLETRSQSFKAEIRGDYPEHLYPAEAQLELKEGSQVMFLRNDVEGKKYFNGKLGVVTRLNDHVIKVKCAGESAEIEVKKHEWKNINYTLNKATQEITEEDLGSFSQYPLRLAWAITIHKSQGLTFDKMIIDSANAFANGQVYVALSRCTSLEGLILTSPINREFLGAHQDLEEWKQNNHVDNDLQHKFDESRKEYVQQELLSVFTWRNWFDALRDLNATMNEIKNNLPVSCFAWIKEVIDKQLAMEDVADKFREKITLFCNEGTPIEENQLLQKRIKDAAIYFSAEMTKWKELFHHHPLTTDTKRDSKQIDASLEEINIILVDLLHKLNHCKSGFILNEYLKTGKKPAPGREKIQSTYAQNQPVTILPEGSAHDRLYSMLADMRRRLAGEKNVALYEIFSNATITNVCAGLPADKEALLKVKGFGKVKVKQYGDEVIDLVHVYCDDNNLEPQYRIISEPSVKKKKESTAGDITDTVAETVRLFKEGKSIPEIAKARSFALTTIEGHVGRAITDGLIYIEDAMSMDEVKRIAEYFPKDVAGVKLGEVKAKIPEGISYGKLRMVLGWLLIEKGNQ